MANDNLTGQFISDTYKRLIVLSEDGYITDGTGSIINELPVTASFAQTALFLEGFDPNNKPAETDPVFTAMSGSFTTTSSFNNFTSSYYQDSASFNSRIDNISVDTSSLVTTESFNSFTSSYNTGSFTGSFIGTATTASYASSISEQIVNDLQFFNLFIS